MSFSLWIAIGTAMCGGALVWFVFEHGRRSKVSRLENREDMSFDDIYQQYFLTTGIPMEKAKALWLEVVDTLELPGGRLRPSDRFSEELAPEKGYEFDDATTTLAQMLQQYYKKAGLPAPDLSKVETIYDYIVTAALVKGA